VTLAQALHRAEESLRAAGIEDAWLEAELLLRHALELDRRTLFARLQEPVEPPQQAAYDALLERRLAREPTAYIVGRREFYGLDLECTPAALISRPETELLVEETLGMVRAVEVAHKGWEIVDVGTGNGAVAVALAVNLSSARIIGIDVSGEALLLARRNAERHGVAGRACFVQGDLLSPLARPVDIIVADLPYVPTSEWEALPPEIREHEPRAALDGGPEGTALLERLLAAAPACLRRPGFLLAEIGDEQGDSVRRMAAAHFPEGSTEIKQDLAGLDRLLVVTQQTPAV
jgi:release factor glutamine methyltransferase